MARKTTKPVFRPKGIGVETAGPVGELSIDTRRSNRNGKKKQDGRRTNGANESGWRRLFSVTAWLRFVLTFGSFALLVHGLFVFFGIYERNQRLANFDHFVLLIKLVVFVALMYLFYAMLMHYRPIRHKVRGVFFLALAPVAALCIFMIYGGGALFGSFVPVLQFLILTAGVGGFLLYILGYTWVTKRKVRRDNLKNPDVLSWADPAEPARQKGLPPGVHQDRRKVQKPGNLRLRSTDGGPQASGGGGRLNRKGGKVSLPEI